MPLLARLCIKSATSNVPESIFSTGHLPKLKTLFVSSSLLVSAAITCNLVHPDNTDVTLFCNDPTSDVDLERILVRLSRQMSLSNSRSHNPWIGVTIENRYISVKNCLGYGCWEEGRAKINANLSWRITDTTWHTLIGTLIAAFGSNFQEATSLEFGMEFGLIVPDTEASLLRLLRKFESVELLSCPFDWRVFTVLQRTDAPSTVSPFDDSEAEAERDLRILFPSLRNLKPLWIEIDVDYPQVFQDLIPFLRHRSSVGANITTLYRDGFEFDVHQIRLIKELALQVFNYLDDENEV